MDTTILKIISLSIFIVILGCDVPNRTRTPSNALIDSSGQPTMANNLNSNSGSTPTPNPSPIVQQDTITIPSDASNCNWFKGSTGNFQYVSNHLGRYNICRSTTNSKNIYFQIETPEINHNICFIPTSNVGSNSFYIGEPRCFRADSQLKIYMVDLLTNRVNFGSYNITGLMIMKDQLTFFPTPYNQNSLNPDAYLFCSEMLYQRRISSYCETFKSVGNYEYYKF